MSSIPMDMQGMRRDWIDFVNKLDSLELNATEFDPQTTGKRESPYVSLPHDRTLHDYVWEGSPDARLCENFLSRTLHGMEIGTLSLSSRSSLPKTTSVPALSSATNFPTIGTHRRSLRAHPVDSHFFSSPPSDTNTSRGTLRARAATAGNIEATVTSNTPTAELLPAMRPPQATLRRTSAYVAIEYDADIWFSYTL